MITDIASYLRFFDGVRRRTERDIAALPPTAAAWRPPALDGEAGWSIGEIVAHIGGTRLYFASAYRGEGWIWGKVEEDMADQRNWLPWLETSAEGYAALRSGAVPEYERSNSSEDAKEGPRAFAEGREPEWRGR